MLNTGNLYFYQVDKKERPNTILYKKYNDFVNDLT